MDQLSRDVYQAAGPICRVATEDLALIRRGAEQSPRRRCRICAHSGSDASVHEMIIALDRRSYVRPHRHIGKSESFHLIEGAVDVVVFDAVGAVSCVIELRPVSEGGPFYYRLSEALYHMPLTRSEMAIIHETTNGPFRPEDTEYAPWAPEEGTVEAEAFRKRLLAQREDDGR